MIARVPGESLSGIRRPPPRPFGDNPSFPFTAATPDPPPPHPSGLSVRIELIDYSKPHPNGIGSSKAHTNGNGKGKENGKENENGKEEGKEKEKEKTWRSGERLSGNVIVERRGGKKGAPVLIKSLTVAVYSESRTLYTVIGPPPSSLLAKKEKEEKEKAEDSPHTLSRKVTASSSGKEEKEDKKKEEPVVNVPQVGNELHRVWAGRCALLRAANPEEFIEYTLDPPMPPLDADGKGKGEEVERTSIPFIVPLGTLLPGSIQSIPPRSHLHPTIQELARIPRTPPPTYREGRDGSVEWVVEAVLRIVDPEKEESEREKRKSRIIEGGGVDVLVSTGRPTKQLGPTPPESEREKDEIDPRGFLQPAKTTVVTRKTFTFLPDTKHILSLYPPLPPPDAPKQEKTNGKDSPSTSPSQTANGLLDGQIPHCFARDLREESSIAGTRIVSSPHSAGGQTALEKAKGKFLSLSKGKGKDTLVGSEGVQETETHAKEVVVKSGALSKTVGNLRIEITFPTPFFLPRHLSHLSVPIRLTYLPPPSASAKKPPSSDKIKSVTVTKAVAVLSCRTVTRGGRDERGWMELEELRRTETTLLPADGGKMNGNGHLTPSTISTNTSATPSRSNSFLGTPPSPSKKKGAPIEGGLEVQMGRGAKESILRIPLQTEDWNAATARKMEPMRRTGISFRTPNIEKEHLLSITLFTTSHPNGFYVARVPIQILTGESDEVVDFDKEMEEAIAKGEDWTKIDLGGRKGGVGGALLLQGWGG